MSSQTEFTKKSTEDTVKQTEPPCDLSKNVNILGRGNCGKTSLLNRYVHQSFFNEHPATPIGNEEIQFKIKDKSMALKVFDTSGQEDYSRFRILTLPASDYVLVCFSVTDMMSFSEVEDTLVFMIKQKAPEHVRIILCATKIDQRTESCISPEEGLALAHRINALKYFECSAKTGQGINEIFDFIKLDMYKQAFPEPEGFFKRIFGCCGSKK